MQDLESIIDKIKLKSIILEKFDTQANFAKEIGYTEPQLSKQLNKPSPKFLIKVKNAGININEVMVTTGDDILKLKEELRQVSKLLGQKEQIIESQANIIKNYENIIKTLKEK